MRPTFLEVLSYKEYVLVSFHYTYMVFMVIFITRLKPWRNCRPRSTFKELILNFTLKYVKKHMKKYTIFFVLFQVVVYF